jgi:hypothetical protein
MCIKALVVVLDPVRKNRTRDMRYQTEQLEINTETQTKTKTQRMIRNTELVEVIENA